jgi:hypothetical protein
LPFINPASCVVTNGSLSSQTSWALCLSHHSYIQHLAQCLVKLGIKNFYWINDKWISKKKETCLPKTCADSECHEHYVLCTSDYQYIKYFVMFCNFEKYCFTLLFKTERWLTSKLLPSINQLRLQNQEISNCSHNFLNPSHHLLAHGVRLIAAMTKYLTQTA